MSKETIDKNVNNIKVSVVMPIYNEEKYISKCVDSLLEQDYPKEKMEWLFVDGGSTDNTLEILNDYIDSYPGLISLYNNPKKTVPYAMNIGIKRALGDYIVRLDAHSEYNANYISKCIYYLEKTGADNVGGIAITKGRDFIGQTIALMLSSKFGVGDSQFRTYGKSGYVDTVPFGAFPRETFDKYGLYDERLTRNEDNELNYRIRKNGGRIYMSNDIKLTYYSRDTIKGISDMAFKNGKWNIITTRLCPGSMSIRHFVPFLFVLSLIFLPILFVLSPLFKYMLFFELFLYMLLNIYFSYEASENKKKFLMLLILFPIFHISYGFGSIIGIVNAIMFR